MILNIQHRTPNVEVGTFGGRWPREGNFVASFVPNSPETSVIRRIRSQCRIQCTTAEESTGILLSSTQSSTAVESLRRLS